MRLSGGGQREALAEPAWAWAWTWTRTEVDDEQKTTRQSRNS